MKKRERVPSFSLLKSQRFFLLLTYRWWGWGGRGSFLVRAFSWSFTTSLRKGFYVRLINMKDRKHSPWFLPASAVFFYCILGNWFNFLWWACQCRDPGDVGPIPGSGRFPGGGDGNPLQYSCLENPRDRGAWQAMNHRVAKSRTCMSVRSSYWGNSTMSHTR